MIKGTKVYIPLTVDKKVMKSVMDTHAIPEVTYEFQAGKEVIPYLAPHEIRNLFGGTAQESHAQVQVVTVSPECPPMYTLIPTGLHMCIHMCMTTNTITTINQYSICLTMSASSIISCMRLLEMSDSQFPVGNFSFSNGLETASYEKIVHDADTLSQYAHAASLQSAYSDGIAAIQAYRA